MNLTIVNKSCITITRPVLVSLCVYQSLRTARLTVSEIFDLVGKRSGEDAVSEESLFLWK